MHVFNKQVRQTNGNDRLLLEGRVVEKMNHGPLEYSAYFPFWLDFYEGLQI